jgi:anti-anti-sigma factor
MILGERLRNLREDGDGVLLDLRGLTLLDSSGVRALLAASAEAERDGRALRVVPPSGGPLRVLQLCDAEGLLPLAPESS